VERLRESIDLLLAGLDAAPDAGEDHSPRLSPKFGILRSESQLELDFQAHVENQESLGLLFFDIDYFKNLNTKHTEMIVDQTILVPFQHHLLGVIRDRGYAYSVGGDEFIVLLVNVDSDEAYAFANRLRRDVCQWLFPVGELTEKLTVSVGVVHCPTDATSLGDLRQFANTAENTAKKSGRDRVVRAGQRAKD
jgi:diguanylate cyclase (GGDEF)-like protein